MRQTSSYLCAEGKELGQGALKIEERDTVKELGSKKVRWIAARGLEHRLTYLKLDKKERNDEFYFSFLI